MTLAELKTLMESVDNGAFVGKVAYRAFPVGSAPELPYICIVETETDNFTADSKVYQKRQYVDIELYTDIKQPEIETALENTLNDNLIVWDKAENYIDDEDMIQLVYEVVI
jgi:hypothetical protein